MKKMMNWVMAAILICGAGVFTSCSSDDDENVSIDVNYNPSTETRSFNRVLDRVKSDIYRPGIIVQSKLINNGEKATFKEFLEALGGTFESLLKGLIE